METEKMKTGARLMAKWPDTEFYYWSTLIDKIGDKWKIQFDDGTIAEVKQSDLHESLPPDARNIVGRVTRSSPTKLAMRGSPTKQVMRGSPTKQGMRGSPARKRPEEIRKSPARKVRKLFTADDNIKLASEITDLEETVPKSGTADARPSLPGRSVSGSKEIEETKQSATGIRPSSPERSLGVSRERSDETQNASDLPLPTIKRSPSETRETTDVIDDDSDDLSSGFKKSSSITRELTDVTNAVTNVHSSPVRRSVSITKETEGAPRDIGEVRRSSSRPPISITAQNEYMKGGAADVHHSPAKSSYAVDIQKESFTHSTPTKSSFAVDVQKESFTHSVTKYTESYLDRDLGRRRLMEGSTGAADLRSSPFRRQNVTQGKAATRFFPSRLNNPTHERHNVTQGAQDLRFFPSRSITPTFDRQTVTQGAQDLRFFPSRSITPTFDRQTVTQDVKSYVDSYLESDFRRQQLKKGGPVGLADLRRSLSRGSDTLLNERGKVMSGSSSILSSPNRRSVSLTKDETHVTSDTTLTSRYSLKDYENKHLNKYAVEYGGRFGSFLLIFMLPLYIMSVFAFNLVPDTTKFELSLPKRLVLIPQGAFFIILFLFMQAVLSIVPIGTVVSGPLTKIGILNMHCNGLFAFVLTLLLILSSCYYEKEVANFVVSVFTEAAVSAMFLGIIFSLILYRRARKLPISYLNPYGATGFKFYDFWMGREMTPRIGKFNIKLILHRFSTMMPITLNILIVTKAYFQGEEDDLLKSLMISTIMQSLYCFQFLFHEETYLYSFLANSEGVGYMITLGFMTYPFILTFTTKVILDYRLKTSLTEIYIALCAYIVGHLLLELSNWTKTLSVRDPITSVWKMKVESKWNHKIQTRAYLGEIISYWAFAMVTGTTYRGVFIIPAAFTVGVLSRAFREYTRCAAFQGDKVYRKQ